MAEDTLFSGESKNIEYKVAVPEKSEKYMKTVVAFANGRGGKIVFGIDDKTLDIVGMDEDNIYKTMDAITNAISDACEPAIRPDVALQTVKDKTVIVVEILPGAQRPYYVKSLGMVDGTYVRVSGTTRHVEGYMLKESEGKVYPTNAYALLTGKMPQMPVIQCGVFKGTNRAYFVDRREFEGSIQEQMEVAYQYVLEKINMGMTIKGMYRQDVYELPTDSIRELIANAVAHRSYLEPGNIQVALFDDRLEVTSQGMLLNNVTISKMMEGYSKPRNPAIARAFAYMKIIEKWGTGIPRLFEACEEYGLPKPELVDFDGDFRVNMYRKRDTDTGTQSRVNDEVIVHVNDKVNNEVNDLLDYLKIHPEYTVTQIAEHFEVSRKTIAARLKKLKEKGYIERVGSSRKGYWKAN